jgi:hypothetical protein
MAVLTRPLKQEEVDRSSQIIHGIPHLIFDGALVIKEVLHLQPHLHFACAAVLLLALTQDLGHNIAAGFGDNSRVGVIEETHPEFPLKTPLTLHRPRQRHENGERVRLSVAIPVNERVRFTARQGGTA